MTKTKIIKKIPLKIQHFNWKEAKVITIVELVVAVVVVTLIMAVEKRVFILTSSSSSNKNQMQFIVQLRPYFVLYWCQPYVLERILQ